MSETLATTVEEAVAGRPGWIASRPTTAERTVVLSGQPYTGERWAVVRATVQRDPAGASVVLVRMHTRSGWAGHRKSVISREARSTLDKALDLADQLLAAVVEHDSGATA